MQTALDTDARIDERTLSKLRWRCRRGLLENDLFIERFFARYAASLTLRQAQALQVLLDLSDNDLLIEKFFAQHETTLTVRQAKGVNDLMELSDNDLLDLLLKRKEPLTLSDNAARDFSSTPEAIDVLALLRPAPQAFAPLTATH